VADNVAITAGSGTPIATDEVTIAATAVHVQYLKVLDGTADSTNRLVVDSSGRITVVPTAITSAATKTNWTVAATSGTVLASNASRKGASFWNDGTATVYLDLSGGTASATSCTVKLLPDAYYELPDRAVVTGTITGIGSSATGTVRVTEFA
jgi:hypothetical protein